MRASAPLLALALAGCAVTSATEPSLARRSAEAIDPRLPIPASPVLGPADAALSVRLAQLVAEGNAGARSFDAESGGVRSLVEAAGPAQSESWVVAQEAVSRLEAERALTTRALSDIDAIAATRIQSGAGIAPGDLAAIEAASAELRAVATSQAVIMDRLGARLER